MSGYTDELAYRDNAYLARTHDDYAFGEGMFSDCVYAFVKAKPENAAALAAHKRIAVSTVERWAKGLTCPHPYVRVAVMTWIEGQQGQP